MTLRRTDMSWTVETRGGFGYDDEWLPVDDYMTFKTVDEAVLTMAQYITSDAAYGQDWPYRVTEVDD
jgi:hypothetical protein